VSLPAPSGAPGEDNNGDNKTAEEATEPPAGDGEDSPLDGSASATVLETQAPASVATIPALPPPPLPDLMFTSRAALEAYVAAVIAARHGNISDK
jgi:hypothetical protein